MEDPTHTHLVFTGNRPASSCAVPWARGCLWGGMESQGLCRHEMVVARPGSSRAGEAGDHGAVPKWVSSITRSSARIVRSFSSYLFIFFSLTFLSSLFPLHSLPLDRFTKLSGQLGQIAG